MNKIFSFIKQNIFEIFGFLIVLFIVWLFAISTRGEHLTQQFFDGIRTTSNREEVVILGIDDKSLQTIGAWPFNRKVFADVTKNLDSYGAKAIVYDVLFLEKRQGDEYFNDVLNQIKTPVVLASKVENGTYLSSFFEKSSSTNIFSSLSNVDPDIDGKIRKYPAFIKYENKCFAPLAEQAFRIITFKKEENCDTKTQQYFRYPISIETYSLVDILSNKIDSKNIKGKVIFIGSTSLDLEDHFVGMSGEKIPGVQVHASILTSLLNNEGDRTLTEIEILFSLLFFISVTLLLLYYSRTILWQIVTIFLLIIFVVLFSYVLFSYHIIFPVPWIILSILLSGGYDTFIRFLREKKQSEYVQSLFSKYVHKDVLKELMKSPESLNLTGEKRYLTILFSDLRGFTTLSESLEPEELTRILNGYFSAMTPHVLNEHGTIDKFIGDAIMAFWNAPLRVENHERHAVLSAIKMQEALAKFNKENKTSLAVGVGIHSGNAVVGNVGSKERVNYTVLGDTVNLASRVESLTKKYGVEILITEEVKNKVNDKNILFRKLDVITVKGKNLPTVLYEVMRINNSKLDIVKSYEAAFNEYQKGEFEKAKILFKELADNGDIPSLKMYERILEMKVDNNWDGVWHFDEK